MTRRLVRQFALATAGFLLCAQVALAGFACPMAGGPGSSMSQAIADGDCPQAPDAGSKSLCEKTCQAEPQKHDAASLDIPPASISEALPIERTARLRPVLLALPREPDCARPTSPPLRIKNSRFNN